MTIKTHWRIKWGQTFFHTFHQAVLTHALQIAYSIGGTSGKTNGVGMWL